MFPRMHQFMHVPCNVVVDVSHYFFIVVDYRLLLVFEV